MRTAVIAVTALFIAILACRPALAAGEPYICVAGGSGSCGSDAPSRSVFTADTKDVFARVFIPCTDMSRAEFVWYSPDGSIVSRTAKLAYFNPQLESCTTWARFGPGGAEGWWRVEVTYDGGFLSKEFMLTENRQVLTVISGKKDAKLREVRAVSPGSDTVRGVLVAAAEDPDPEVAAAALSMMDGMDAPWAAEAVRKGLADSDDRVRLAALGSAGMLGTDEQEAAYMEALSSEDPRFRLAAAGGLGKLGGDESADALMGALSDADPDVRLKALVMLAGENAPGLGARLGPLVGDDNPVVAGAALDAALALPDSGVKAGVLGVAAMSGYREQARRALDALLPMVAAETLPALMKHFREGYRRHDILDAVASVDGGAAVEYLAEAYRISGNDEGLRLKAVSGLAGRGDGAAGPLEDALSDPSAAVRKEAVSSLVAISGVRNKAALLGSALSDGDPLVKKEALAGLASLGTHEAYAAMMDALDDPLLKDDALSRIEEASLTPELLERLAARGRSMADGRFRLRVVKTAVSGGIAPSALTAFLGDPDNDVKRAVLAAMKSSAGPGMVEPLKGPLADTDAGIRLLALEVLSNIEGQNAGGAISSALGDDASEVRVLAGRLLLKRTDKGSVPGIAALLDDDDPEMRAGAADALAGIEDGGVEDTVYGVASTGGPEARTQAIGILERRGSGLLGKAVIRGLADDNAGVRYAALDAAGSLDGGEKRQACLVALESPDPLIRLGGARGLEGEAGEDAVAGLVHALSDEDARVRLAAVEGLEKTGLSGLASRLPELVNDADRSVAKAAFEAAKALEDGEDRQKALLAAASGEHRDIAEDATDLLMETVSPGALGIYEAFFRDGYRRDELLRAAAAVPGEAATGTIGTMYRMSARDEDIRVAAVDALAGRGENALQVLVEALSDPSIEVRRAAISSIGSLRDMPGALDALGIAIRDINPAIKADALDVLCGIPDQGAAVLMLPALNDKRLKDRALLCIEKALGPDSLKTMAESSGSVEDPSTRVKIVRMLAEKGLDSASLGLLLNDTSGDVVSETVTAIRRRGGPDAAYVLLTAGAGGDTRLRDMAEEALAAMSPAVLRSGLEEHFERGSAGEAVLGFAAHAIRDPGVLEWMTRNVPPDDTARLRAVLNPLIARRSPHDAGALLEGLAAQDGGLREEVLWAVAGIEPPYAGEALYSAFARYPGLGGSIIEAGSASGHAAAIAGAALGRGDPGITVAALEKLDGLPCGSAGDILLLALDDKDQRVRAASAAAAAGSGCAPALIKAAGDVSADVRATAASGMGSLPPAPDTLDALTALALDAEPEVSDAALSGLQRLGDGAGPGVWAGIFRKTGRIQAKTASLEALGNRKDPEYIAVIADAMADDDADVAGTAEGLLIEMGKDALDAVHPLLAAEKTRLRALDVVGAVGDPSSEGHVIAALSGLEGGPRSRAVGVLGRLGGIKALDTLARIYRDSDEGTRIAVLKAVSGLRVSGGEPGLADILSDALASENESFRFYAVRAVGEKRVLKLKDRLSAMQGTEGSVLVRTELDRALGMF